MFLGRVPDSSLSPNSLGPLGARSRWWAWLAARCWRLDRRPRMHQAGTSNPLTALLAQRAQPARGWEGGPGQKEGLEEAVEQNHGSQHLKARPALQCGLQPPKRGPSGLCRVTPAEACS